MQKAAVDTHDRHAKPPGWRHDQSGSKQRRSTTPEDFAAYMRAEADAVVAYTAERLLETLVTTAAA